MVKPWLLVTPASRGIGFELARRLLASTTLPVVATVRRESDETKARLLDDLNGLDGKPVDKSRLDVLPLDVTDEESIASAAAFTKDKFSSSSSYLHLAFALPGVLYPEKSPAQIDADHALETLKINLLGPMLLAKHFAPQLPSRRTELLDPSSENSDSSSSSNAVLPRQATFALMAARVGSTADDRAGGWYSYRASKAGVISLAKSLNIYLSMNSGGGGSTGGSSSKQAQARAKAMAVALHPGTVKTGLSKQFWSSVPADKLFEPAYAADRLLSVVAALQPHQAGRAWDWKGEEVPP